MEADALHQVRDTANQGLRAIPRRGLEVGGLIIGSWEASDSPSPGVCIRNFLTVEIAYGCGPRFLTSADDEAKLRGAIKDLRSAGESVIGWWRSHILDVSLVLSADDLSLTQSLFGGTPALVLQVLPKLGETPMSALHVVTGSECHTSPPFPLIETVFPASIPSAAESSNVCAPDWKLALSERIDPAFDSIAAPEPLPAVPFCETPDSVMEGPLHAGDLSSEEGSEPLSAASSGSGRTAFVGPAEPEPGDERPGPTPSPSHSRETWQDAVLAFWARVGAPIGKREFLAASLAGVAVVALILLLTGVGRQIPERFAMARAALVNGDGSASRQNAPSTDEGDAVLRSEATSSLQLSARQVSGGLLIEWDRQLEAVRGASGGTLAIEDSGERKEVALTPSDLQAGSVMWFPRSDSVRFELTLLGTKRDVRGILQAHGLTANARGEGGSSVDSRTTNRPAIGSAPVAASGAAPRGIAGKPPSSGAASGQVSVWGETTRATRSLPGDRAPQGKVGTSAAEPATAVVSGTNVPAAGRPTPLPAERAALESARSERRNAEGPECRTDLQTLAYYEKRSAFGFLRALRKLPFVPGSAEKPSGVFQAAQTGAVICPEIADAHLLSQPSEVEVIAKIGADGAVRNAELSGSGDKSYVALRTVESIRKWKFQPATISNDAVVSEVRLRVHWRYPHRPAYAAMDSQ